MTCPLLHVELVGGGVLDGRRLHVPPPPGGDPPPLLEVHAVGPAGDEVCVLWFVLDPRARERSEGGVRWMYQQVDRRESGS